MCLSYVFTLATQEENDEDPIRQGESGLHNDRPLLKNSTPWTEVKMSLRSGSDPSRQKSKSGT